MTRSAVVNTASHDTAAGEDLARQICEQLGSDGPDAVIVFASPKNNYGALLDALDRSCRPATLVGCSTAGEFTNDVAGEGLTCAIALRSPEMQFSAALGRNISGSREAAVVEILRDLRGVEQTKYAHRAALVLADVLAGFVEDLVDRLTTATGGAYRFFGGGAGDDARFQHTHVFCGTQVHSDAAVVLEMLSNKPIGIGARHGWQPASAPMRVTDSESTQVRSLNVAPAVEVFDNYATTTKQKFEHRDPMPFFLHNIVGVQTPGGHKLRVPLGVTDDGSVVLAGEVPTGATAHIMATGGASAIEAASTAAQDAMQQVVSEGHKPAVALFFDCVATRLRLGQEFKGELDTVGRDLQGTPFAGFNSYGQIVRAEGQFSGFHNCTAVVCVIPE